MNPRLNELLRQLPDSDYQRLAPHLCLISLNAGTELYALGDPIKQIYFPVSTAVAAATLTPTGQSIDTAIVAADGMVGLRGIAEGDSAYRFHVIATGLAYSVDSSYLMNQLATGRAVYRMCFQAGLRILHKMSMELACTNFHSLSQRIAKWLLIRHDYDRTAPIRATHQSIADSLGVRRESITNTLYKMRGLSFSRCAIEVEDRTLLENASCECYVAQREVRPFQLPLYTFDQR